MRSYSLCLFVVHLLFAQETQHPYQPGIDALHYDFVLQIPDTGKSFLGTASLLVCRNAPVGEIRLDLIGMTVTEVLLNRVKCTFSQDTASVSIALPSYGGRNDTFRIVLRYSGTPKDGLIFSSTGNGGWSLFGDNWPNRARYWLPCIDHPSDKATVQWTIETLSSQTVVANGELIDSSPISSGSLKEKRTRTVWRSNVPIPTYTMVIAVAPFICYDLGLTAMGLSATQAGVDQMIYVYHGAEKFLPGAFAKAGAIVDFFSRTVGPFPYEKLAHVQSSTRYGGMENASAIFYNAQAFSQGWMSEDLIAHETSHQWFGDDVTPREWGHIWLSEGFATYFTALWTEHSKGEKAFIQTLERSRKGILGSPVVSQRPVIDTTQIQLMQLLNTNSYNKGGWVLHMLRHEVGDEIFFRAIKSYYQRYKHGAASSDELLAEFERHSSRSLGWFFDQWLRKPGFVDCTITWNYDQSSHSISTTVAQSARFGFFRFPLVIQIEMADGSSRRVTIEVPPEERSTIQFPDRFEGQPKRLIFDPDVQLLAKISIH
ncbi:MAG: M1 family metallopeptidase [bacterium]